MSAQIEKIKQLKAVYLEYSDGSVIAVPENQTLTVGTAFVQAVGAKQIEWHVVKTGKPTLREKVQKFFQI